MIILVVTSDLTLTEEMAGLAYGNHLIVGGY